MPHRRSLAVLIVALPLMAATRTAAAQEPTGNVAVAQDSTVVQEIALRDGTTLIGRIIRIEGTDIRIRTLGGTELTVRRRDIARVRVIRGTVHDGAFWERDPSDSRLLLGPTARVPPHGHGYAGSYELFLVSAGVGIGGRGMISAGMSLIPGLAIDEQVFYVAPKLQLFDIGLLQGAAGVFWVKPWTSEESAGMVFGGLTAGPERASFSGGIGFPFASQGGFADQALVMLGGEIRGTRHFKLLTENWLVPGEDGAVMSLGVRFISRSLTVELGAATTTDGGFLPIVNVSAGW